MDVETKTRPSNGLISAVTHLMTSANFVCQQHPAHCAKKYLEKKKFVNFAGNPVFSTSKTIWRIAAKAFGRITVVS
jgi:uridylate kinase